MRPPGKAMAGSSAKEGEKIVSSQEGPTELSPELRKGRGVRNRVAFTGMVLAESRAEKPRMRHTL